MSATNSPIQTIQARHLVIWFGLMRLNCRAYGKATIPFIPASLKPMMKLLEHVERVLNARSGVDNPAIRDAINEVSDLLPHQRLAIFAALRRRGLIS